MGQLLQIDYMKTQLGSEFNYKEVIDENNMLDPKKITNYAERNGISTKTLFNIAENKPKTS
jgi:hypothetical protein